jgi:hypothetical protein
MRFLKRFISLFLVAIMLLALFGVPTAFAAGEGNNLPLRDYFPNVNDTDFFSKMPLEMGLQDPFTFFTYNGDTRTLEEMPGTNGKVVTEADWIERRDEIKDLLMYYWYGYKWDTPKEAITSVSISSTGVITMKIDNSKDPVAVANGLGSRTWTGTIGTITMPSDTQIGASPFNKADGIPFVIGASDAQFRARGIATVSIGSTSTYTTLYPYNASNTLLTTQSGSIMTNAWVVSRILDAMEMHPEWGIDAYKGAVNGVSIGGKIAHIESIFDDRVAVDAPCESGGGGLYLDRGLTEGRINYFRGDGVTGPGDAAVAGDVSRVASRQQKMTNAEPSHASTILQSLFVPNMPGASVYTSQYLPFDAHLGIALMAPSKLYNPNRAMLGFTNDSMGAWIGPRQQELNMRAAKEVFDFLGSTNITNRVRNGSHAAQGRDKALIVAALEYLFNPAADKFKVDYISGWNNAPAAATFNTIADSWATPFEVDSSYIPWSNPKAHTLRTESEIIGAGIASTITAHSGAPQVKLTLWAPYPVADASWTPVVREKIWEKTVNTVGGAATFDLSKEDVQVGRYELTTVGGTLQQKSVYFQAIDAATALRSGMTRDNTNYNTMYGFSSKINKSALELYSRTTAAGAEMKLASSYLENAAEGWIYEYGAAHKTAIANGAFIMRKLQMEAMPGYTFDVAFSQATHFLVGSKAPATWGSSPEAQNIGPWTNWPVPGGLGSSNGTGADSGARPAVANRTTNVLTTTAAGAQFSQMNTVEDGDTMTITFATAMNPNDFGIGFDFSDDFSLAWAADNKSVTVTFNNVTKRGGEEYNLYIMRLRDSGNNFITAPIHYSFATLGPETLNVTTTANLVTKGSYFDVAASFENETAGNAAIVTVSYDQSKFRYTGNLGADSTIEQYIEGVTYLGDAAVGAGNVKLTLMIPDYKAKDLINLRFQALEDVNLENADECISVNVKYALKPAVGDKIIMETSGSTSFSTVGEPGDTDGNGTVNLIDLSNVIDLFGVKAGDALWSTAKFYDFNKNKVVDIADIVAVAKLIL